MRCWRGVSCKPPIRRSWVGIDMTGVVVVKILDLESREGELLDASLEVVS
jgi:hypothetical protein